MAEGEKSRETLLDINLSVRLKEKENFQNPSNINMKIRVEENLYPCCIVWSPLPLLSWFFPFIGHLGITNQNGVIYDFAGPYSIGENNFAFGSPTKYLQLDPADVHGDSWNGGVKRGCDLYSTRMHNLCCDNCHSHVATCLNIMKYRGCNNWNMIILCFWIFFCGKYTDFIGVLKTWLPFLFFVCIFLVIKYMS